MSDEELSLVIAEFLEPFTEDWNSLEYDGQSLDSRFYEYLTGDYREPPSSPLDAWRYVAVASRTCEWQPRNMVTDPAMRDMLQRKLLEEGWSISLTMNPDERLDVRMLNCDPNEQAYQFYSTFERFPSEAFVKAKGLWRTEK